MVSAAPAPAAFLKGRVWSAPVFCIDPIVAWGRAIGAPLPLAQDRLHALARAEGVEAAARAVARAMNVPAVEAPAPGDVVVAALPAIGATLGLCCGALCGFVLADGRLVFARPIVLAAFRLRALLPRP